MNANRTSGCEHPCKSAGRMFLNFSVNSKSPPGRIALQSDIAEELHMEGDAARIHQLVSLLVDNAVKYTPEGGKSTFSGEKTAKKQNFRCRIPAIPCRKVISTTSLTASTVRMRRGPGKAAAMESAFPCSCNCKGT